MRVKDLSRLGELQFVDMENGDLHVRVWHDEDTCSEYNVLGRGHVEDECVLIADYF